MMISMHRLSWDQRKSLSDVANMMAVAWFTAGVIAPIFAPPQTPEYMIAYIIQGCIMTVIMMIISLMILQKEIRGRKYD